MIASEAIILAGGRGTRLQGIVRDVPKVLALVQGRPFIAWLLDALDQQRMRRVILAAGYKADILRETLGLRWGRMALDYSVESTPLGTGGAITSAAAHAYGDAAFVLNGDTYLELDYAAFATIASGQSSNISMAVAHVENTARYGAVRLCNSKVVGFDEKGASGPGWINAGVYWLHRNTWEMFDTAGPYSFEQEILPATAAAGRLCAYTQTQSFIDIGVPDDYCRAQFAHFSGANMFSSSQ